MKYIISYKTRIGTFYIAYSESGLFHPVFNDESLGGYQTIYQAVDDLTQNATDSVLHPATFDLVDTSDLGIPDDPNEWERLGSYTFK